MSFSGKSPSVKRTRYTPQSADPVNPAEGDFFYADGTSRIEGPWVYQNGAWQQVQTSGALSTVNDLTFIPQSSDPSAATGKVFYADGTSRAEGLWIYDGTQWVQISGNDREQEFFFKNYSQVRLASIGVNIPLSNIFANGSNALDGVTLVNNDIVLIKDQAIASENGVYQVGLSGPPTRATVADTFAELNDFAAIVNEGTVNANTTWFQNNTLTSLSDDQSWTATPDAKDFTIPENITTIVVTACGGGGGGGGGGGIPATGGTSHGGGGGAGGCGATIITTSIPVTPGEIISVTLGDGGTRVIGSIGASTVAPTGGSGGLTTITCSAGTWSFPGAVGGNGGTGGAALSSGAGGQGNIANAQNIAVPLPTEGGDGAPGSSGASVLSTTGQASIRSNGGPGTTGSRGGSGGGGGASMIIGAAGGVGFSGGYTVTTPTSVNAGADASKGGGGGGGGGAGATAGSAISRRGATSGAGGPGYVRISW